MSRSSRSGKKKTEAPALTPRRLRGGVLLSAVVLAVALVVLVVTHAQERPDVPEPSETELEPMVKELLEERRAAVFAEPASAEAWGQLGIAFQAHGLFREASASYLEASKRAPEDFRWSYLNVHALRATDRDAAVAEAERAARIRDDYAPLYILRGEFLEEDNDLERALEMYERAVELDSENAMAAFGVGRVLLTTGDVESALPHLERALQLSPDATAIHASLAQAFRRLGERERAREEARLASGEAAPVIVNDPLHFWMRQESVSSIAQLQKAQAADAAGDHARAEAIYRRLVALRPDDADMWSRLGDSLAQQSKQADARKSYESALAINPDHASALYGLATAQSIAGEYDDAESNYRRALAERSDHVPTLLNLGGLLVYRGALDEAKQMYERGLAIEPGHFGCHRQLGLLLLRQGNDAEAIEHFQAALESQPELGPLHVQLAMALARSGDIDGAWRHVADAKRLGADLPPPFLEALEKAGAPPAR